MIDEKKKKKKNIELSHCWTDLMGFSNKCVSDHNFAQVRKVVAFRGDNQAFNQHQPDGNAFIRTLSF